MADSAKISFWGTSGFALPSLKALVNAGFNIVSVVTMPDMPAGREQILKSTPVKEFALAQKLEVATPQHLSDNIFFDKFTGFKPDAAIVAAYGKIIPERYLGIPKHGFINIHPSLLPKYRGPSPIQTAILRGEKETGITIMLMDKEMDHGPILAQEIYQIDPDKYFPEVASELANNSARLLVEILPKWLNGELKSQPQDHSQAIYTKIINREDGKIDWTQSAADIRNKIRALNPEPGTWTNFDSLVFKIYKAKLYNVDEISPHQPGTVYLSKDQFLIKAGKGWIAPEEVQLEGKRRVTAKEFIRGYRRFSGIVARN